MSSDVQMLEFAFMPPPERIAALTARLDEVTQARADAQAKLAAHKLLDPQPPDWSSELRRLTGLVVSSDLLVQTFGTALGEAKTRLERIDRNRGGREQWPE